MLIITMKYMYHYFYIYFALVGQAVGQHISNFECLAPEQLSGVHGIFLGQRTAVVTRLKCAQICSTTCSCDVMQYCPEDKTCAMYSTCPGCVAAVNLSTGTCSNNKAPSTSRIQVPPVSLMACGARRYLVTDDYCGVKDAQLSESSHWCQGRSYDPDCAVTPDGHAAKWGRRDSSPEVWGSWVPRENVQGEYIQVDFLTVRLATGVVLMDRNGCCIQYVTAFKLYHSLDCVTFTPVSDNLGNEKVFAGCTHQYDEVTHCFDQPISARCIRLSPTGWAYYIALRFDILGI